eukprot:3186273-Alexandrium_andersonii.AAC.1
MCPPACLVATIELSARNGAEPRGRGLAGWTVRGRSWIHAAQAPNALSACACSAVPAPHACYSESTLAAITYKRASPPESCFVPVRAVQMAVGYSNDCRAVRSQNIRACLKCSKLELRGLETASTFIPEAME